MTSTTRTSMWRFAVSQALMVLTAWLSIAPALHAGDHDRDCDPAVLVHDESQHHMSAGTSGSDVHPGDHCVACHLFRSSRHIGAWRFIPQTLHGSSFAVSFDVGAVTARAVLPLAARAPPALT